jgi:hypothetical protein
MNPTTFPVPGGSEDFGFPRGGFFSRESNCLTLRSTLIALPVDAAVDRKRAGVLPDNDSEGHGVFIASFNASIIAVSKRIAWPSRMTCKRPSRTSWLTRSRNRQGVNLKRSATSSNVKIKSSHTMPYLRKSFNKY